MEDLEKRKEYLIDTYQRNWDNNTNRIKDAYKNMNNIIFIISTGTFVVAVSFISYIKTYIHYSWMLLFSWIFSFITIILNFYCHWLSAKISETANNIHNKEITENFPHKGDFVSIVDKNPDIIIISKKIKIVNPSVLISLCVAIIFLILFGWINLDLQNRNNLENLKNNNQKLML